MGIGTILGGRRKDLRRRERGNWLREKWKKYKVEEGGERGMKRGGKGKYIEEGEEIQERGRHREKKNKE